MPIDISKIPSRELTKFREYNREIFEFGNSQLKEKFLVFLIDKPELIQWIEKIENTTETNVRELRKAITRELNRKQRRNK